MDSQHGGKKIREDAGITGRVRIITTKAGTGEVLRTSKWTRNLLVSSANFGRNLICQRLAGTNTYTLNVTHGDLGTGTNIPANSDTGLQTPVARGSMNLGTVNNNVATLQFFLSDAALPDGTYNEFGSFVDGTATLSTGQLFNRALFSVAYVKASGEDTTIELELTIN